MPTPTGKPHWLGFDLGGTKMQSVLFNQEFESAGRRRRKTKGQEGAKAGVERIVETMQQTLQEAGIEAGDLSGIGIGCPGLIDLDRGLILDSANLGWKNVKLKDLIEEAFHCPVVVLNDVDAGVYGEYCFGAGKGARSVAGIFPGTGIGGGFVYEGHILRGRTYSCMEIGHVQVVPNGRLCGCGRVGCLETEASRLAIAAEAAKAVFRGEAPHLLRIAGTDLAEIRSSQIAESISSGDEAVEKIVRRAASFIGVAVAELVNLLLPEVIVLGGGLVEAMPGLFLKEVERSAQDNMISSFGKSVKIAAAKLGDDAGVRGAAAWVARHVESQVKSR